MLADLTIFGFHWFRAPQLAPAVMAVTAGLLLGSLYALRFDRRWLVTAGGLLLILFGGMAIGYAAGRMGSQPPAHCRHPRPQPRPSPTRPC